MASQFNLKNFPCIKVSPFKYILHFLNRQGLIVKSSLHDQCIREPSSNDFFFFLTFPQWMNKSQWIIRLSVAITCSNSTSWAKYPGRIHILYIFFFLSADLTAEVQMRKENRTPVSEFPFRTCSLLLQTVKQSDFHENKSQSG